MGERIPRTDEVTGSNPVCSIHILPESGAPGVTTMVRSRDSEIAPTGCRVFGRYFRAGFSIAFPIRSLDRYSLDWSIMKFITVLSLLLLTSPAFAELTKEELRAVIREEIAVSEKRTREYMDLKIDVVDKSLSAKIDGLDRSLSARIDAVDKRLGDMRLMVIALVGLIAAAVAIPQIVIAYKGRGWKQTGTEIQQLREVIKALQNASS